MLAALGTLSLGCRTYDVRGTGIVAEMPRWMNEPGAFYPCKPDGLVYAVGVADREASHAEQMKKALQNATEALARQVEVKVEGQITSCKWYREKIEKAGGLDKVEQEYKDKYTSISKSIYGQVLQRIRTDAVCRVKPDGALYILCCVIVPDAYQTGKNEEQQATIEEARRVCTWTTQQMQWMTSESQHLLEMTKILPVLVEGLQDHGGLLYPEDERPGITFSNWDDTRVISDGERDARRRADRFKHCLRRELIKSETVGLVERGWRETVNRINEVRMGQKAPKEKRLLMGQIAVQKYSIKVTVWSEKGKEPGGASSAIIDLTLWDTETTRALETELVDLKPNADEGELAKAVYQLFEKAVKARKKG